MSGIIGRQYYPDKQDPEAESIGWNWQDSYGFDLKRDDNLETQRKKIEHTLKTRLSADAEWQPNGALHVLQRLPAVRRIASTGQPVLFNGLGGVYGRQRDRQALEPPHIGTDGGVHLPTTYGDGSAISNDVLERYLAISDEIGFLVPWEEGDVALIDNYTVQVCFVFLMLVSVNLLLILFSCSACSYAMEGGTLAPCQSLGRSREVRALLETGPVLVRRAGESQFRLGSCLIHGIQHQHTSSRVYSNKLIKSHSAPKAVSSSVQKGAERLPSHVRDITK